MLVIFCSDPLRRTQPDPQYAAECGAARAAGADVALMNFEALVDGDAEEAVRRIDPASTRSPGIYRGWMLRPTAYAQLYAALARKGAALINTPDGYRACHYLPEYYPIIKGYTPETVWLPVAGDVDMEQVMRALQPFGDAPVMLKDYVKSRKHEWAEACYIPSAADRQVVTRIVNRFLQLQGPDLSEGLVFRRYVPLESLGTHPRSGMPLAREYRRFYLDGEALATIAYWEAGEDGGAPPPDVLFAEIAQQIPSRFFTMDIARAQAGHWLIVELGDGQVARLPDRLDADAFYRALLVASEG